jgi:hypothetical protein
MTKGVELLAYTVVGLVAIITVIYNGESGYHTYCTVDVVDNNDKVNLIICGATVGHYKVMSYSNNAVVSLDNFTRNARDCSEHRNIYHRGSLLIVQSIPSVTHENDSIVVYMRRSGDDMLTGGNNNDDCKCYRFPDPLACRCGNTIDRVIKLGGSNSSCVLTTMQLSVINGTATYSDLLTTDHDGCRYSAKLSIYIVPKTFVLIPCYQRKITEDIRAWVRHTMNEIKKNIYYFPFLSNLVVFFFAYVRLSLFK